MDGLPRTQHRLARRHFLKLAALAPVATAFSSAPLALARRPAPPPSQLRLWWWGEDMAIGITRWLEDTVARFQADAGVSIEPTYLTTDEVVPRFTEAAAVGNPPDVQYLWNGSYHMENV